MSEADIRHDLFVYETDAAAVAQIERFAVAGLEADESVMVVISAAKQRLLREAFGAAAEFVMFVDTREIYTRPEHAMAAFDGVVRKSVEGLDAGLRVYGELPVCTTQAEWNGWIAYESAVNRAFASRPVVLMCGYDARVVPEAVVRQAWQAHRVVHSRRRVADQPRLPGAGDPRAQPRAGVRGDPGPALAARSATDRCTIASPRRRRPTGCPSRALATCWSRRPRCSPTPSCTATGCARCAWDASARTSSAR